MTCHHLFAKTVATGVRDWELGVPGEFRYVECENCELVKLEPHPDLKDLVSYYPSDYPAFLIGGKSKGTIYEFLFRLKSRALRKKVESLLHIQGANVLDIGCGSGELLGRFHDWGAGELHGIDFSPIACGIAEKKGVTTHCGTFLELPIDHESMDLAIMHHYIEHTLEPEKELRHAFEVLKPSGVLLLELPNFRSLDQKIFGRFWGGNHVPRHTFQFKDHVLVRKLREAGFSDIRVQHEINPAHFALSIQNFIQYLKHGSNPRRVRGGRATYFSPLLLALVPIQILSVLFRCSGMITVTARKSSQSK